VSTPSESVSQANKSPAQADQTTYSQDKLRFLIFLLWIAYLILSYLTVLISSKINPYIEEMEVPEALVTVTGLWTPVLGCLAAFWFGVKEERQASRDRKVDKYRAIGAVICTMVYLTLFYMYLCWATFFVNADTPAFNDPDGLPKGALSFPAGVFKAVKWAALVSPLGTAPVIWLTAGIRSKPNTRNGSTQRRRKTKEDEDTRHKSAEDVNPVSDQHDVGDVKSNRSPRGKKRPKKS
jgi:hypothetical protein